ncbi:hypothetical protein [uncultured Marixanthomonas sp.]|uniref:hypothetical protein n=1 Tax=uncultured Marixanthomonas sp. TaxID=757245 RepID=UPI0030D9617C|tara:strand:- start:16467 stop:17012 length:546 start_codon:yes stop_codon:yes gene_type:complete
MRTSLLIIAIFFFFFNVDAQNNSLKEIYEGTFAVNSITAWRGKTRVAVPLQIPANATGFYYTVYVSKRKTFRPEARKLVFDVLADRMGTSSENADRANEILVKEQGKYEDINIYLLPSEQDSQLFEKRMNYDFKALKEWKDIGEEVTFVPTNGTRQTLYLGFLNTNNTIGLDVYLKVAAKY